VTKDEREKDPNYHHCWCKFYRDNEGKWVMVSTPVSHMKLLGPPPACGICDNTGWCT